MAIQSFPMAFQSFPWPFKVSYRINAAAIRSSIDFGNSPRLARRTVTRLRIAGISLTPKLAEATIEVPIPNHHKAKLTDTV
jgi:hypothetical protein